MCHVGGGGVQFICLVGCRLPPLDGYVTVCVVSTIDVYGISKFHQCLQDLHFPSVCYRKLLTPPVVPPSADSPA